MGDLDLIRIVRRTLVVALFGSSWAYADSAPPELSEAGAIENWAFKLTPSYYVTTHQDDAVDLNLRANHGSHAMWIGYYRHGREFEQTRTGYEYTAQLPFCQLVPSVQLASHGFAGGSITAMAGDSIFALLGYGRTNAHEYYNLNFDPNDSVTYGVGTRLLPKSTVSLFAVRDNRLHTGQVVSHLVWRTSPDDHQRWTVDLSSKHGRATVDDEAVSGKALSVTYDYRELFVRLARDRKVNFTTEDQTRLSLGVRF